jgi:hypothetical protein
MEHLGRSIRIRLRCLGVLITAAALASVLALTATACGSRSPTPTTQGPGPVAPTSQPTSEPASPPASAPASPGAPVNTQPAPRQRPPIAAGPVWPVEPRTLAGRGAEIAVLASIRTGRHRAYERVVLDFGAPFGAASVRYVPAVREDPSDRRLALAGQAFLAVTVHSAVAKWPSVPGQEYSGPATVTPGYPTVRQIKISGDFEAVLSFGIGLDRRAGFRVDRLTSPDRLVIDVANPPAWRLWPETSLAQARAVQAAVDRGHQPWRLNPVSVAALYGQRVYGFPDPHVRVSSGQTYRLSAPGSADAVTVRVTQPVRAGSAGIWAVADTR